MERVIYYNTKFSNLHISLIKIYKIAGILKI